MNKINIIRFGFATGMASVILYIGCIIVMATASREASILFFNSLMHGIDIEPILREKMGFAEVCLGIATTFVIMWFFGAMIGLFYNICPFCKRKD